MTRTAKQSIGLFLSVVVLGVLAWRLWPDGGRARQQQRNTGLLSAVLTDHLSDATQMLDEGADPNVQTRPFSVAGKAQAYYYFVSHKVKPPDWGHMDDLNPRLSVLQIAVDRGDAEMVGVLLTKGADVRYRDKAGSTALDLAEIRKATLPPTTWNASTYPRIVALLKGAEARNKKAP